MRKLLIAATAVLALIGMAQAQTFNEATPKAKLGDRLISAVPEGLIGQTPVGAPTFVVPPAPAATNSLLNVGQAFSDAFAPYINAAIQALLAAALSWLAYFLNKKLHINITEGQRNAVQTWLTNQASSLIADGAVSVKDGKVSVDQKKLEEHVAESATQIPDALKFFGLTPDVVAAKIVDKIPQVPAGAQIIAQATPKA